MVGAQTTMQQLELVREAKIFDILPDSLDPRLEASGVLSKDGLFYVIFDNLPHIACIGPELSRAASDNHLIAQQRGHRSGFEDIAYDSRTGRFYVLIESLPRGRGTFMAAVQEYDDNFRYTGRAWLDFPLDRPNKGLEGLTCVHRDGQASCSGCVRATSAREARRASSPGAGGSMCSGALGATGTGWAQSGCRKRCCSRTTAASRWPATGSRSYPRHPRSCGSATSRQMSGRSRAQAQAMRSPPTLMAASSTGRSRACHGWHLIRWSWSRTRPSQTRTADAGPRTSPSTSSIFPKALP